MKKGISRFSMAFAGVAGGLSSLIACLEARGYRVK
jgi:hypothetical protein